MGWVGRGRVIKGAGVNSVAEPVHWEPEVPEDSGPDGEVEVIKEGGEIQKITVRCKCGRSHELELVDNDSQGETP